MNEPAEQILMEVNGLILDPQSNVPIVILREPDGAAMLPIWIGVFEANAIAMKMEGVESSRPMTHDLLLSTIQNLDAEVRQIVITRLEDSTFYAEIYLSMADETELKIDARPSDAIALALRAQAPIFVDPEVLAKARVNEEEGPQTEEERIRKWLEELDPDDLGKYTM